MIWNWECEHSTESRNGSGNSDFSGNGSGNAAHKVEMEMETW